MSRKDLDDAIHLLQASGLAFPPVPSTFVRRFRAIGPWRWGSRAPNPFSMYMFEHFAHDDQRVVTPPDYVALCHAGHGVNSYALTYHLVYRPVAIIFQIGWGGIYMDGPATVARFNRQCELADTVVEVADRVRSRPGPITDLGILQLSDLRGIADFQVVQEGGHAHAPDQSLVRETIDENAGRVYGEAATWLSGQP